MSGLTAMAHTYLGGHFVSHLRDIFSPEGFLSSDVEANDLVSRLFACKSSR